jgi:hypothetical protein
MKDSLKRTKMSVAFRLWNLLFVLILVACFIVGCRDTSQKGKYLSKRDDIRNALPEEMQNDKDVDALLAWHRQMFGRLARAIGGKTSALEQLKIDDMLSLKSYGKATEIDANIHRIRDFQEKAHGIMENLQNEYAQEKERFASGTKFPQEVCAVLKRMPMEYFLYYHQREAGLEKKMLDAVVAALTVVRDNFNSIKSEGNKFKFDSKKNQKQFEKSLLDLKGIMKEYTTFRKTLLKDF